MYTRYVYYIIPGTWYVFRSTRRPDRYFILPLSLNIRACCTLIFSPNVHYITASSTFYVSHYLLDFPLVCGRCYWNKRYACCHQANGIIIMSAELYTHKVLFASCAPTKKHRFNTSCFNTTAELPSVRRTFFLLERLEIISLRQIRAQQQ